jgi:hypothetical protein
MRDGDRMVTCRITCEALEDIAGAHQPDFDYLVAFEANRDEIEAAAGRNFKTRKVDMDGVVVVRSADVAKNWLNASSAV